MLSLLSHYEDDQCSTMVVIKDKLGQIFKKRLEEIARDPEMIKKFSAKDAHLLGYLLGFADQSLTN
jgi:hypothetical protein